jgi:YidC/Oxa1 family membrane protein insertase
LDITAVWNLVVVHPLMLVLQQLAVFTGGGGLAIILMTLIIKSILLPLSLKQTNSMKAMQAIQPEIAALRKKIKDKEKLTQETMALYKERGVNPASGCLPMLPTMVVLIGLYGALTGLAHCDPTINLDPDQCQPFRQPFLWVPELDQPDAFHIPALGFALPGILPIAMAVSQFFSSKMMSMPSQDPQQQMMNRTMTVMMPAMMLFWGITFPAGLVLYWFVSNVYEMVRLRFTMGPGGAAAAMPAGGGGGFSFGSLLRGSSSADGADGAAAPAEDRTTADQAGDGTGARANGRPARTRGKRGKRGRR